MPRFTGSPTGGLVTLPLVTLPLATLPLVTLPLVTLPLVTTPGHSTSGRSTPGHSAPGHCTPGHCTPGQSTPGHSTPGHYYWSLCPWPLYHSRFLGSYLPQKQAQISCNDVRTFIADGVSSVGHEPCCSGPMACLRGSGDDAANSRSCWAQECSSYQARTDLTLAW